MPDSHEVYQCRAGEDIDNERMIVESEANYLTFHVVDCEGTKSLICLLPSDANRLYLQLAKHIEAMK